MLMPSIFGESLLDDWFDFPFEQMEREGKKMEKKLYGHHAKNIMKTDVKEKDDSYELTMDLPGFKKEEVKAELKYGYLTISAAKGLEGGTEDKDTGKYIRKERYTGAASRTFYIGEDITQDEIKAEFKHGILKLHIPKKDSNKAVENKNYIAIEG